MLSVHSQYDFAARHLVTVLLYWFNIADVHLVGAKRVQSPISGP